MAPNFARRTRRSGATTVEFAIVASVFFMFLFGILEFGRLIMVREVLDNAAREGARYAVVHTYDKTTADVEARVRSYLAGQDGQMQNFTITVFWANPTTGQNLGPWTDAGFGQAIAVRLTGGYVPITPFMPSTINMDVQCIMLSEAN